MKPKQVPGPRPEAYQRVRLQLDTKNTVPSIRIGFTDQRLTAHGGLIVWSHFLRQKKFRQQLREVLPHDPTSPNAGGRQDIAGTGGLPFSGAGNEPADERRRTDSMAPRQRPGRIG